MSTCLPLRDFDRDTLTTSIATHYLAAAHAYLTQAANPGAWLIPFLDLVTADWFTDPHHRALYDAMVELAPTTGGLRFIGGNTIVAIVRREQGNPCLWMDDLLLAMQRTPIERDQQVWTRDVLPLWRRHLVHGRVLSLIASADEFLRLSPAPDRWEKAAGQLSSALETMAGVDRPADGDGLVGYLDQQLGPLRTGAWVSTGLPGLDHALGGGFGAPGSQTSGRLIVLAARPSMGKSQFAIQITHNVLLQRQGVWMASLEMGPQQVYNRLLACYDYRYCRENGAGSPVPSYAIRSQRFSSEQRQRLEAHRPVLDELNARFILAPGFEITPQAIVTQLRFAKRRNPDLTVAVIDHLGLLELTGENRSIAVGAATRIFKLAAEQIGIDIVLVCQLNRGVEQRADKMPMLSDLRDSGGIEQDADVVIFLLRPGYYDPEADQAELIYAVAKNREGSVGRYAAATYAEHCAVVDAPRSVA